MRVYVSIFVHFFLQIEQRLEIMADIQMCWGEIESCRYGLLLLLFLFVCLMYYIVNELHVVMATSKLPKKSEREGVSVIITSHNSAESLKRNLPSFLMQEYPNYEVIVVDECSEDNTQEVLVQLQQEYPQLRFTRIYPDTKFRFTKKLAINIGVLAARHDILLFSETNCRPVSSFWVRSMQTYFDKDTAVVLGFANYDEKERVGAWKRYFRLLRFIKILVLVRSKQNILGDGCNMGYRKSYYIRNRGFTLNSQSFLGYDSDMVRELSKFGPVKVAKMPNTYVLMDKRDKKEEEKEISYYFASKMKWSVPQRLRADADRVIRFLFYGLAIYLMISGILVKYVFILMLFIFLLDVISINICALYLKQKNLFITSFIESLVSFGYRGYWNVYSFFNRKKWR